MSAGRRRLAGRVGEQRLQQRGLAQAVAADQHDAFAAIDHRVEVVDDGHAVVGLGHPAAFHRQAARRPVLLEADVGPLDVRPGQLGGLQPLHFLAPRLHLARTGAGREALDEVVELRDLLLALFVLRLETRADLGLGQHHLVVAAGVGDDRLVVDVGDVGADGVEEVAVVGDDHAHPLVTHQELAQPVDRVEVEVVGRLVEQQRLRPAEERLGQQHPDLLPALQLGHRPLVQVIGNVEAGEQHRRVALGRVAVVLADRAFEFAEPHPVGVAERGLGVQQVPLLERRPQDRVAHDHRVDDPEPVEGELVLTQHAEPLGPDHRTALRRQIAGQQLHERRLAGAVGAGQAVAPPVREHRGDVVEEHLRAVAHRDAADRDHRADSPGGPEPGAANDLV